MEKNWERELYRWLDQEHLDRDLKKDLKELVKRKDKESRRELEECFYRELEFGTSGIRGIMGPGPNRLNVHNVRRFTQGICDYMTEGLSCFSGETEPAVAIAYDSRINSRRFAECTAGVLAANGIKAYMYDEIVPVAALSFAVIKYRCAFGIMITASHNPKEYNGYKVYGASGCQIIGKERENIYRYIKRTDVFSDVSYLDFDAIKGTAYFTEMGAETRKEYLDSVMKEKLFPMQQDSRHAFSSLKCVYSPLNGAGNLFVREMAARLGVEHFMTVRSQERPDGRFLTCPVPNPEREDAFSEALGLAKKERADIVIATDPDCDRLGVAVKTENGSYRKFTGNETAAIIFEYIIRCRKEAGTMPEHPVAARSVVSNPLADIIGAENGIEVKITPTGFCYIGSIIDSLKEEGRSRDFIFGFEESSGYLSGDYVRDKDGVNAAMLILCAAACAKEEGSALDRMLQDIYSKYGCIEDASLNFEFPGIAGNSKMKELMEDLRRPGCFTDAGFSLERTDDYLNGIKGLPPIDMVEAVLTDGSGFMIRPSGTEPKIKAYIRAKGSSEKEALEKGELIKEKLSEMINKII